MTSPSDPKEILIVDDDNSVLASLALLFHQAGYRTSEDSSPEEAIEQLRDRPFSLVIQDMNFSRETSGEEGLRLLAEIRRIDATVPVILLTAWGNISLAVRGMKAGATDFVTKPWDNHHLLKTVETALSIVAQKPDGGLTREELDERYDFSQIVGQDPELMSLLERAGSVAATDAPILLLGESGTGKELVAEAMHENSTRSEGPFIKVNLGGLATSLFESEMFGHVKGAFTDAVKDREGRFLAADGGTIFLDEIGDLEPASQVKMLRVLQDHTFEALGSSQTKHVDVRVISATNRDLPTMVSTEKFREDLFYRLNLITLTLPPLRERREDIPLLAAMFCLGAVEAYKKEEKNFRPKTLSWLKEQDWPGNVRQLRQTVERAVLVTKSEELTVHDCQDFGVGVGASNSPDVVPFVGKMTLIEIERAMIEKSLIHFDRNITKAAGALGLSRAALYRKLEKHGIGT